MPFLDSFFKILPAAQKIWLKQGPNRAKEGLEKSKINSVDLKKKSKTFSKIF